MIEPKQDDLMDFDDSWDADEGQPSQPYDLWTRTNLGENLPYPISPLTATAFPALFGLLTEDSASPKSNATTPKIARRFFGRLYINEGAVMHNLSEEYGLPSGIIDAMWGSRRRGVHRSRAPFRPLRLLRHLPLLLRQNVKSSKTPKRKPEEFFAQIEQWVNEFAIVDLDLLDDQELFTIELSRWRSRGPGVFKDNMGISTSAAITFGLLERIVGWWTGQKEMAHDLVTGLSGVYSAEVGPALWEMAKSAQDMHLAEIIQEKEAREALATLQQMPEASLFIRQLTEFLERHGHRCPNEVEFLNPRWAEEPEEVLRLLIGYLSTQQEMNPLETEVRQRKRREQAVNSVESKLDPFRRFLFRFLLAKAQNGVRQRDNSRYYVTKFIYPVRRIFARLGKDWADRGWLTRPEDIFFLTLSEIELIIGSGNPSVLPRDLHSIAHSRRRAYDYWYNVDAPDAIGPDGRPIVEDEEDAVFLQGVPASGGIVVGKARLVNNPHEAAQLRPGDILVTMATDPGWTPVFPLVSGLVLEIGGQLSHGAIVAREYGIPAVVNVQGARRQIQEGQIITVNGTEGKVYLSEVSR